MRRTVATLLVVASPLLMAGPVSAESDRPSLAAAAVPAAPAVQGVASPAPAPVSVARPAVQAPAVTPSVAPPAVQAPAVTPSVTPPAVQAPAVTPPIAPVVARATVKKVLGAKTPAVGDVDDAAYAARLQADLCQARQIFCGLDRSGHYPAG